MKKGIKILIAKTFTITCTDQIRSKNQFFNIFYSYILIDGDADKIFLIMFLIIYLLMNQQNKKLYKIKNLVNIILLMKREDLLHIPEYYKWVTQMD